MKKVILHISNDYRSYKNKIFDTKLDVNWSVNWRIKNICKNNNVDLQTLDIVKDEVDLAIFFNVPYPSDLKTWSFIKKNRKNVLFIFEPPVVNPFNYLSSFQRPFNKIFTWDDSLVENRKFFKFYWPQSKFEFNHKESSFNNRKLLTMINGNKLPFFLFKLISSPHVKELYSERIKAVEYFEDKLPEDFDLYGQGWNKPKKYNIREQIFGFKKYQSYKGEIENKIKTLSKYRFSICFENITNVKGYITEKIFDCFKAKCIPVYWGASNITKYIPKDCFIDFRDFMSYEKLLNFIQSVKESEFNKYIDSIKGFLYSSNTLDWFEDSFSTFFLKIINSYIDL